MTERGDLGATYAYTCREVDAYLRAVADQSAAYRAAIAEAQTRTERAQRLEQRIVELERRVGESVVAAHIEAASARRQGSVSADGARLENLLARIRGSGPDAEPSGTPAGGFGGAGGG